MKSVFIAIAECWLGFAGLEKRKRKQKNKAPSMAPLKPSFMA